MAQTILKIHREDLLKRIDKLLVVEGGNEINNSKFGIGVKFDKDRFILLTHFHNLVKTCTKEELEFINKKVIEYEM